MKWAMSCNVTLWGAALLLALMFGMSSPAHAQLTLTLDDGTDPVQTYTGSNTVALPQPTPPGVTIGAFDVTSATGVLVQLGSSVALMDLDTQAITLESTGAGTLTIDLTASGLSGLDNPAVELSASLGGSISGSGSAVYQVFYDGTSVLDQAFTSGSVTYNPSIGVTGTDPYSMEEQYVLTSNGAGEIFSLDGDLSVTAPEPGTLILLGTSLIPFGLLGWRRRITAKNKPSDLLA